MTMPMTQADIIARLVNQTPMTPLDLATLLQDIIGNNALPVDRGPYTLAPNGRYDEHGSPEMMRAYLEPPTLARATWEALATALRSHGHDARADETGLELYGLRVTATIGNELTFNIEELTSRA